MYRIAGYILGTMILLGCSGPKEESSPYPLLSLFEASQSLDGKNIQVIGYFAFWDGDIPVLYATHADYERSDGLYKAHLIHADGEVNLDSKATIGKLCIVEGSVWYRNNAPTIDQARVVTCR